VSDCNHQIAEKEGISNGFPSSRNKSEARKILAFLVERGHEGFGEESCIVESFIVFVASSRKGVMVVDMFKNVRNDLSRERVAN